MLIQYTKLLRVDKRFQERVHAKILQVYLGLYIKTIKKKRI